jgi:hypothetical protein
MNANDIITMQLLVQLLEPLEVMIIIAFSLNCWRCGWWDSVADLENQKRGFQGSMTFELNAYSAKIKDGY